MREFPGDKDVRECKQIFEETVALANKTRIGGPAPEFALPDITDEAVTLTKVNFKGKYLLLDFWGTWCGPCKRELPGIHEAYAKFKDKGLEILSISCDKKAEDVREFRKKPDTPMPWKHGFGGYPFGKGKEADKVNPVFIAYNVRSFPNLFLLDPDGNVVAKGDCLRQEGLMAELTKIFNKEK